MNSTQQGEGMMDEFHELIKFLNNGGTIAVSAKGTHTVSMQVHQRPRGSVAGLRRLGLAEEAGLVRVGDMSPIPGGVAMPYVLTEKGRKVAKENQL